MSAFTVWTIPGSPFARAVIAVLIEKGAPFRVARLQPGTLTSGDHLARHPFGKMPVLDHGDFRLYETQAILRYLDRVLPAPALTPDLPAAAARMDQVMNINDHYLFNGVANVIGFQRVVGPLLLGLAPDENAIAAAMPAAHTVFAELSRLLGAPAVFAGERLSLAAFLGVALGGRDNIVRWHERLNGRASIRQSTMAAGGELAAA